MVSLACGAQKSPRTGTARDLLEATDLGVLVLLLLSGALIHPDLGNLVTAIKLGAVLLLMLNGLAIAPLMQQLLAQPPPTSFKQ